MGGASEGYRLMGKHFSGEEGIILGKGTVVEDEEKLDARVEGLDGMRNTAVRSKSANHPIDASL